MKTTISIATILFLGFLSLQSFAEDYVPLIGFFGNDILIPRETPTCVEGAPITGNPCVDSTCCVIDNVYEDPGGLLDHAVYVSCVADAVKACGLIKKERGKHMKRAAKSSVNK